MAYQFKVIERDWYKRRKPTHYVNLVSFQVNGFKKEHNHMCRIHVVYNNGAQKSLIARVIYNKLTSQWTVDGMEVALLLIGDDNNATIQSDF